MLNCIPLEFTLITLPQVGDVTKTRRRCLHLRLDCDSISVRLLFDCLWPVDCAFPVAASRAWNSLPPAIRTVSSFTSFGNNWRHICL